MWTARAIVPYSGQQYMDLRLDREGGDQGGLEAHKGEF